MKTLSYKIMPGLLIVALALLSASFVTDKKGPRKGPKAFLEVEGKPSFEKPDGGNYKVSLIYLNRVIAQQEIPVGEGFEFELEKNVIYSVRIEKEGFLPRLISINTAMPEAYREHIFYKFQFDVEMYSGFLEKYLDSDDIDFPVAVISYDEQSDRYDYSRNYTQCAIQRLEEVKRDGISAAEGKITVR